MGAKFYSFANILFTNSTKQCILFCQNTLTYFQRIYKFRFIPKTKQLCFQTNQRNKIGNRKLEKRKKKEKNIKGQPGPTQDEISPAARTSPTPLAPSLSLAAKHGPRVGSILSSPSLSLEPKPPVVTPHSPANLARL
jgi:hypothetical protein